MNKKRKSKQDMLMGLDAVEIYKMVIKGDQIERFPRGFWQKPDAELNAIKCVKWLIEEYLKLTDEELKKQMGGKLFKKHHLGGMFSICFNSSPYQVVNTVYPSRYKPWEFDSVPSGYWQDERNGVEATRWLIEDKLGLSKDELKEALCEKLFIDNGLGKMLKRCFNNSTYRAIYATYPDACKYTSYRIVAKNSWTDIEKGIESVRWLIEDKLKLSDDELKMQLSCKMFSENELGPMLRNCFEGSPYKAVDALYPGKYKPWEFKNAPMGYWSDINNAKKAVRWLIEEKLKLSDEEVKSLTSKIFKENGLNGMMKHCFSNSPYIV